MSKVHTLFNRCCLYLSFGLVSGMALAQPRTDGIYRAWYYSHSDTPEVTIHRYIRFYPDGSALVVSSSDASGDVARWLVKELRTGEEGRYSMKGAELTLEVPTPTGQITYSGRLDGAELVFGRSRYSFHPQSDATPLAAGQNRPPIIVAKKNILNNFLMDSRGQRVGLSTTVEISASDPDGDALTFQWKANNGSAACQGASCAWRNRPVSMGRVEGGYLTVTVEDGKGGRTSRTWLMY
jgi:hypothetical protein